MPFTPAYRTSSFFMPLFDELYDFTIRYEPTTREVAQEFNKTASLECGAVIVPTVSEKIVQDVLSKSPSSDKWIEYVNCYRFLCDHDPGRTHMKSRIE